MPDSEESNDSATALGGGSVPPYRPLVVEGQARAASGDEPPNAGVKVEWDVPEEDTKRPIVLMDAGDVTTKERQDDLSVVGVSVDMGGGPPSMVEPLAIGGAGDGGGGVVAQQHGQLPSAMPQESAGPTVPTPVDVNVHGQTQTEGEMERGPTQAGSGPTQPGSGPTQAGSGPTQAESGLPKTDGGPTQAEGGPTQVEVSAEMGGGPLSMVDGGAGIETDVAPTATASQDATLADGNDTSTGEVPRDNGMIDELV